MAKCSSHGIYLHVWSKVFKEECSEWRVGSENRKKKSGGGVRVFRLDLPFEERKRRHYHSIRHGA